MDRPEINENIEALGLPELRTYVEGLRPYAEAQLAMESPDDLEFLELFASAVDVLAAATELDRVERETTERARAAVAQLANGDPDDDDTEGTDAEESDEEEAEEAGEADDEGGEPEAEDAGDQAEEAEEAGEQAAEVDSVDRSSGAADDGDADLTEAGTESEETEVDRPNAEDLSGETGGGDAESTTPQVITTASVLPGVPGFEANASIDSRLDVARALGAKWETVGQSGTGERFTVVQIKADYPDFADFTDGDFSGIYDDAIVAACAPLEPYYGVGFYSSEARPVFDSLPKFLAPRGGVTIYPSPRFSDPELLAPDTGFGQWTHTDDNNAEAEKNECYELECGETSDFRVYGVYRCMTVRNLDAITFPELVAAHQNQLGSRYARYADRLILDAMVAQADENIHASATYGASRTILSRFDQIGAQFRENERLSDTPILDVWLPRWIRNALREDVIRANNGEGVPEVVVDATISSWFGDIGLVPHFTFDNPTVAGDLSVQSTGHVNGWPDSTWYIMSVRGNLALLDLGTINIGVNPNGTYRDTGLVKRNRFQMFMESFEGLVNRGAPVWRGEVEVIANGAAPAGVTALSANTTI